MEYQETKNRLFGEITNLEDMAAAEELIISKAHDLAMSDDAAAAIAGRAGKAMMPVFIRWLTDECEREGMSQEDLVTGFRQLLTSMTTSIIETASHNTFNEYKDKDPDMTLEAIRAGTAIYLAEAIVESVGFEARVLGDDEEVV